MAIQEDIKRKPAEPDAPEQSSGAPGPGAPLVEAKGALDDGGGRDGGREEDRGGGPDDPAAGDGDGGGPPRRAASPSQLGTRRFVYAAYFAGAIGIAFLASKVIEVAWTKLQSWKPMVGEPQDEVVMPLSALVGGLAALYYWRRTRARELAEQVATEMGKVTWPSRTEVTNGTVVVIVTTVVSTVFFALMDKFWGFVTNLVYGGS
jgi:preprotein translocase subunit SecE